MEELEAIDWYSQRADACTNAELRAVIEHNRDEEIEHASMTLEWIRRNIPKFDEALKLYLFTQGDITLLEEAVKENGEKSAQPQRRQSKLTIGEMKEG
jgi:ferritin-like protein